ncbi:MAG: ATP-grasp domain-containing protein [Oscillospiraceae bacterium]|nr:ATP-grasp domain-containing protein [Oscillospiraceae bacterium]
MSEALNLLFTSVGRRSYLVEYFRAAMGGKGKICVANSSEKSPAFLVADEAVVTPLIYDDNYIPFLLDYCKKNQIDAIISLFDIDLPILSQNKAKFAEIGTKIVVSEPEAIHRCNDKWVTYQDLLQNGFHVPKTFLSPEEALDAVKSGSISFPLMVKPRWGMGSIAVFEAENEEELLVFFKKVRNSIMQTYLKYESKQTLDACVLIQEKIKGQEYGLDIINDLSGNYVNTICKMKYAMRSGETDCAVTVDDPALRAVGESLSKYMKHIANLDVDIFKTEDQIYVLEMNARFGGGYPFSHVAGVNLPLAIVKWLRGEEVDAEILQPKIGIMAQKDIRMTVLSTDAG